MSDRLVRPGPLRVVQVQLPGYEHHRAFDEVAESMVEGLTTMGFTVDRGTQPSTTARNVVLGAHLLDDQALQRLAEGTVVYNHEQIDDTSLLSSDRLAAFRSLVIWDYSARNCESWKANGIEAVHVPIGWSPCLARIDRSGAQDIDVLFYGSVNERRQRVLDALQRRGARVQVAFGAYGDERDALIARSRLVLNVQFYEARILEMVRLSYLFANAVPVVSETAADIDVPPGFADAAAFATYDRLVQTTLQLLEDPKGLEALGARGRERMQAWPWSRCLRSAVVAEAGSTEPIILVCGSWAEDPTGAPASLRRLVASVTDDLLTLSGARRGSLGPPPMVDPDGDPRVAALHDRVVAEIAEVEGGRVSDPDLSLVLPFWLDAAAAAGREAVVEVHVDAPAAAARAAPEGRLPIVGVLRWLSDVVFAEAFTRERPRDIVVGPPEALPVELGFAAGQLAQKLYDALAGPAPDLDAVDELAAQYLDAMAVYFPLLDAWPS